MGVELDRDPWKMWQRLRQRMQEEAGAHHFKPLAFVTHEVTSSLSLSPCLLRPYDICLANICV